MRGSAVSGGVAAEIEFGAF